MFKINNKNTRNVTDFCIFIVNFEQVNVSWNSGSFLYQQDLSAI